MRRNPGRPRIPLANRRRRVVTVALTDEEFKRLTTDSALAGMTKSDYIVCRTLGLRCGLGKTTPDEKGKSE